MKSGVHALKDDKIIKSSFNKNNVRTIKKKWNSNKDLTTRDCRIGRMAPMKCSYLKMADISLLTGSLSVL